MNHISIPHGVAARLVALGISPVEVLRQARMPQTLFDQGQVVVTHAQWLTLWSAVAKLSDDPALGLKLPRLWEAGPYDTLMITALSSPSFRAALDKVARYKRLFAFEDVRIQARGNTWAVTVAWLSGEQPPPPMMIDMTFACLVEIGRRGTGQPLYPERVLLRREPQHRAMYEAYFRCPVEFEAGQDLAVYSHEAMGQPFLTYNPDLLELLEPQLDAALRERSATQRFADQVTTLLRSRLAGAQPTAQDVARELAMSTRSLQRRLAAEGMHFQRLLETVRHDLAKQYLLGSSLELHEIAFLLGYQETSSFHRAFQHWEGTSPGQWRVAQR